MKFFSFIFLLVAVIFVAFTSSFASAQQQQQRRLVKAWSTPIQQGHLIDAATSADNQESILLLNYDNSLVRISSSTGAILFNVSVPVVNNSKPNYWATFLYQATSTATGTSYIVVQNSATAVVYSFDADHTKPSEPTLILELFWTLDSYGNAGNVILTQEDTIIVAWRDANAVYSLRAFDINPASNAATGNNRSVPIYSVPMSTISSGGIIYCGGVVTAFSYSTPAPAQGFDGKTGKRLWTFDFGPEVGFTGILPANGAGLLFYYKDNYGKVLNAFDARTGKVRFGFEPQYMISGVSAITGNPRIVRLTSSNYIALLDIHTGLAMKQIVMDPNVESSFQLLLGGTRALLLHGWGNNSLWDVTANAPLGNDIQWSCYHQNMPPREICSRPAISAQAGTLPSSGESVVFTMYNPWNSGDGYVPLALDADTGAVLADYPADKNTWEEAPDVLAYSRSSGIVVFFGVGLTEQIAIGYKLE